ncbi:hypothetical protein [Neobacillus niacini]|uniref:hypothetical protein n=1 Tax=Neobacillus niacini TaxID=86668 RepID=UPI0021CB8DA7|nr:hypothetical protein [Neobacillus niacini]MCM3763563.1 hypothetical protein [Neobacillus niacini]
MRKRRSILLKGIILGTLVFAAVAMLVRCVFVSSEGEAVDVVNEFYRYEQEGDFSNSWDLFHSSMRKKFTKGDYIQDRAHVFMNHFGVETFTYTLGEAEKLDKWRISKDGPAMKNVYKVPVTQTYKGKYGNFDLMQEVFVVEEKDEWKIMWDYNQ